MKDKDLAKLDLADWKNMERQAISAQREANVMIATAKILYTNAVAKIKELGGKTTVEEEEEAKKKREKLDKNTTK
jgi:Mg-chelatase subunit ChlI